MSKTNTAYQNCLVQVTGPGRFKVPMVKGALRMVLILKANLASVEAHQSGSVSY